MERLSRTPPVFALNDSTCALYQARMSFKHCAG